jgi:two-component system response regulator BaeR
MNKILVVEDEIKLAELLKDYLVQAQFEAILMDDGNHVVECVKTNSPALILLDLMLPGKDGLTLCKEIRRFSEVPIIMITAKVEEIDRLLGLELGADDYICKPFSPREVIARVKSVLRRSQLVQNNTSSQNYQLNEETYELFVYQQKVSLTAIEFNILKVLTQNPGHIFSRSQLIDHIYDDHRVVSERTVDSHIKKLRKKLYVSLPDIEIIQSVYSVGYKFIL